VFTSVHPGFFDVGEKWPQYSLIRRLCGLQRRSGLFGEDRYLLHLQATEQRFRSLSAGRLVSVSTDVLKSCYSEHITNGCVVSASGFFRVSSRLQKLNCTSEEAVLDTNGTRVKTKEIFVGTFCMHRSTWIAL
jgi:hypothetical protein